MQCGQVDIDAAETHRRNKREQRRRRLHHRVSLPDPLGRIRQIVVQGRSTGNRPDWPRRPLILRACLGRLKDGAFADVRPAFTGHGLCGADPWIQGLTNPDSFHPTAVGYRDGYLPAVRGVLAGVR